MAFQKRNLGRGHWRQALPEGAVGQGEDQLLHGWWTWVNNQLVIKEVANKPVAKHGSVLATSVVHAEVVQWGHHLGGTNGQIKWREVRSGVEGI